MKTSIRVGILLFTLAGVGCTRYGLSTTSSMTISIPYVQQKAARAKFMAKGTDITCINRVMINVTGPAISPPLPPWIWQGNGNNSSSACPSTPSSATFSVPSGSPVLVQVLLIEQDNNTGANTFLYDSASTTPSAGADDPVTLTPAPINVTSGQGQIVGRYLGAGDTVGKTGLVNLVYAPPGQPGMVVDTEEMFAGWLSVFSPTGGTQFSYVFEDGTTLFSAGADPIAGSSILGGTSNMLVSMPASYQSWGSNGDANTASMTIAGFFGPGKSANVACFLNTTEELSNVYDQSVGGGQGPDQMVWIGAATPSVSNAAFSAYVVSGGSSTGACPAADPTNNVSTASMVFLNEKMLANGGGGNSNLLGFFGPFASMSESSSGQPQYLNSNYAASQMTLSWNFVSGATSGLAGFDVFYNGNVTPTSGGNAPYQAQNGNGVDCADLVNLYGFTQANTAALNTSTTSYPFSLATYNSSTFAAAVCPFRMLNGVKTYFTSAASIQPQNSGGGGTPAQMVVTGPNVLTSNQCAAFTLSIEDMSGNALATNTALSFSLSGGDMSFYTQVSGSCTCLSPNITSSANIPASQSSANFCIQSGFSSGYSWLSVNQPQTGGSSNVYFNNQGQFLFSIAAPLTTSASNLGFLNITLPPNHNNTQVVAGQCYQIDYTVQQISAPANPAPSATDDPVVFTPTSSTGGSFHLAPDCSDTPTMPLTIPGGSNGMAVYYEAPANSGSALIDNVSATISSPAYISEVSAPSAYIPVQEIVGNAVPASVSVNLSGSGPYNYSTCYQVNLGLMDSMSPFGVNPASINQSSLTSTYSITVSDGGVGGAFYAPSSPSCSGISCCQGTSSGSSGTASYSSSAYPNLYYLTPSTGGTVNLTASSAGLTSGTANATLAP